MSNKPRLAVVVASTRPGRIGPQVGQWFGALAEAAFEVVPVDLAEVDLPLLDEPEHPSSGVYAHEHTRRWSALVDSMDAYAFVTPEYNHSFPATLKNALDYLSREWRHKPAGLVGYGMSSAGLRATQMLTPVVRALGMVPVAETVAIPLRQRVDDDGRLVPDDTMNTTATALITSLARYTTALRSLRTAA
ncbi:NAD(P)H-dependent oxidoreductase [Saccharothrix sp. NPDC042600]|uniref:NADPH-dependent FMN reductase n=1 Tax=Saccharothrix TaxID=2071 RepID=UPI00340222AE|nr:NAD(P)H-dependent oxidoreductase [Saccharothrix mutabilis subsp. capreolus]